MVTNALTVGEDEGLVVAGTSEDGSAWAKLVWLGDWTAVDLKLGKQSSSGIVAAFVSAAFSAKDVSSKEASQSSVRYVPCYACTHDKYCSPFLAVQ